MRCAVALGLGLAAAAAAPRPSHAQQPSFERIDPPANGGTGCGRGAPFHFFYRPGTVNKLVIDFEGGGGCWDALTCLLPVWSTTARSNPPSNAGLVDGTNPENPTAGWAYLYVPYCTGDVHLGAREAAGVNFNGRANAQAALDYVYEAVPDPEVTLTTGCSAGSLGSMGWAPWIATQYPNARNVQFGDSYIGIGSANHWNTLDLNWDLITAFQPLPGLEPERLRQYTADICPYIVATSSANADIAMGQFTTNADSVQISFTLLAEGPSLRWTEVMREVIPSALGPRSGYYIGSGSGHCTIPGNSLYSVEADGVRLIDWLADLIETEDEWPRVVDCCANATTHAASHQIPAAAAVGGLESGSDGQADWACSAAFAEHYRAAGFPMPNATNAADRARIERLWTDFDCRRASPPAH